MDVYLSPSEESQWKMCIDTKYKTALLSKVKNKQ